MIMKKEKRKRERDGKTARLSPLVRKRKGAAPQWSDKTDKKEESKEQKEREKE